MSNPIFVRDPGLYKTYEDGSLGDTLQECEVCGKLYFGKEGDTLCDEHDELEE